jgi:hypothetical protein
MELKAITVPSLLIAVHSAFSSITSPEIVKPRCAQEAPLHLYAFKDPKYEELEP